MTANEKYIIMNGIVTFVLMIAIGFIIGVFI